jgi:hypothetical protein
MRNWTTEANKARRFDTRQEAQELAQRLFAPGLYSVTEHLFIPKKESPMDQTKNEIPGMLAVLLDFQQAAESIADAARRYAEAIGSHGPVEPVIGKQYATFDGSLVYVLGAHTPCNCKFCAQHASAWGSHHLPAKIFETAVLRGGHGYRGYPGDRPGSVYPIDAEGRTSVFRTTESRRIGIVSLADLSLAGLCLKSGEEARITS